MNKFDRFMEAGIPIVSGLGALYFFIVLPLSLQVADNKERALKQKVLYFADYIGNRDGKTTREEWTRIYKEIGLTYEAQNPRELIAKDLEKFVDLFKNHNTLK